MKIIISFFILLSTQSLRANEDAVNRQALSETQDFLRQQSKSKPEAFKQLSGGNKEIEQGIWDLAADVMPILMEKTGGDPQKMMLYLEEMKRNPAAFANQFKGPEREKLKSLAEKIHSQQKPQKP